MGRVLPGLVLEGPPSSPAIGGRTSLGTAVTGRQCLRRFLIAQIPQDSGRFPERPVSYDGKVFKGVGQVHVGSPCECKEISIGFAPQVSSNITYSSQIGNDLRGKIGTFYILDEPTHSLRHADVEKLLAVL